MHLDLYPRPGKYSCVFVPPVLPSTDLSTLKATPPCPSFHRRQPLYRKLTRTTRWGLIPGHTKSDQSRAYPVAAMVANLAKATPSKPALMTHDSLVTYFHEMVRPCPSHLAL